MITGEQRSLKDYPALLSAIAGSQNVRQEFEAMLDGFVDDDLLEVKTIEVSSPSWSKDDVMGLVIKHARYERMSSLRDLLIESLKTD